MPKPNPIPLRPSGLGAPVYPARHGRGILALAALALATGLGACSGSMKEARPVCIQPHGGANYQLAPSYQCETGMGGRVWVNR